MTYCVGIKLDHGLVLMSDTRTNAGIDDISTYRKMFTWESKGERVISLMTAGNLATTQALIGTLEEQILNPDHCGHTIFTAPTMFQLARTIGETLHNLIKDAHKGHPVAQEGVFTASVLLAGQIRGGKPSLFMIYPEGNFIEASTETPFLQVGETKYGRPILVRAYDPMMSFEAAAKLLILSFDSTVKANLSVAPPFDLLLIQNDQYRIYKSLRVFEDDPQYQELSTGWGDALKKAIDSLPEIDFEKIK